jgi:hypothetical protein
MIDRRVFIHGAAGVAATFVSVPPGARARPAAGPFRAAPDVALVDRHLGGSDSFAVGARARGITLYEFSSDVAGLWMRELEPRLRAGSVAIEGYTSAATLFCLELLARDYGARVVRRGDTPAGVTWIVSSSPIQRAPLAPLRSRRSAVHA